MNIDDFKVTNCPATVYYIPRFLSENDESMILSHIDNTPKPKWTQLSNRRLINYGGVPHRNGMITEAMPSWLQEKVTALNNMGIFGLVKANHVLVNEYLPGQGIMAHSDGPLFHPVISTISCGSHTVLQFFDKDADRENENVQTAENQQSTDVNLRNQRKPVCSLLLEAGSLLVLKNDMYQKYLHSISEIPSDLITADIANIDLCSDFKAKIGKTVERNRRISLTIRHVPKTSKVQIRLGH